MPGLWLFDDEQLFKMAYYWKGNQNTFIAVN